MINLVGWLVGWLLGALNVFLNRNCNDLVTVCHIPHLSVFYLIRNRSVHYVCQVQSCTVWSASLQVLINAKKQKMLVSSQVLHNKKKNKFQLTCFDCLEIVISRFFTDIFPIHFFVIVVTSFTQSKGIRAVAVVGCELQRGKKNKNKKKLITFYCP